MQVTASIFAVKKWFEKKNMKLSVEGKERYLSRIDAAMNYDFLSGWEMNFLNDIYKKIRNNNPTLLSDKQISTLEMILERSDV